MATDPPLSRVLSNFRIVLTIAIVVAALTLIAYSRLTRDVENGGVQYLIMGLWEIGEIVIPLIVAGDVLIAFIGSALRVAHHQPSPWTPLIRVLAADAAILVATLLSGVAILRFAF